MADLALIYDDKELFEAAERCLMNIVDKRMYITGATGSTCHGESFTIDYDLPNRDAYAETCASIALAFFANRMIKLNPHGKYADAVEKVMYNGSISGISMDGKGFFYENPLEIDVDMNEANRCTDGGKRFPITQRKEVFDCSCCPPNVIRFISGIGEYLYSYTEDTLFVNQYISSEAEFDGIKVSQITDYPSTEEIKIKIENNHKKYIALRIPSWCKSFEINKAYALKDGYAYIETTENDEIILTLSMPVRFISANKKVHECAGRVAVMRGPVVYCLEGVDNGKDLNSIRIDIKEQAKISEKEFLVPNILLKAYNLYIDIVYCNGLIDIYNEYLKEAEAVAMAYQKKMENDEATVFEVSKSQLALADVKGQIDQLQVRRTNLVTELTTLNGNNNLNVTNDSYNMKLLPEDFNKWYEYVSSKSPVLQYVNGVVAMQKENVKLSKAQNLPKLSAGYMFEKSVGQHFQGVKLGFALPVWSAKNRMSKVKAELMAAEADAELVHLEFYNRIYSSYNSAKTLYKTALDYRKSISAYSKSELLRAALDSGEMNIIDYFTELNFYNTIKEKALEAERNYYQIMAELESVTF
jgi:hypothetical protein